MRKEFEENLRLQRDVIVKSNTIDYTAELGDLIEKIALSEPRENRGEKEIFLIQIEKQKIMDELKEQLSCLDDPNCVMEKKYEGDIEAKYDEEQNLFRVYGSEHLFSFGDLIADLDWGHYYFFRKGNISRDLAKRYLIECAKRELMDLANMQIVESEIIRNRLKPNKKKTYLKIRKYIKDDIDKTFGLYYERMVLSLLKKIQYDFDIDFKIVEVDKYDDVEHKVDFIINFKEADINIGIQFSVETDKTRIRKKEKKVEKINENINNLDNIKLDKIVTVFADSDCFMDAFNSWVDDGEPVGGPIYYMTRDEVNKIIEQLLRPLVELKLTEPLQFGE